jgi:hypothetical protein
VVFLLTEFPLHQQKSVCHLLLIFVDTYAHTLFLEVNSIFQFILIFKKRKKLCLVLLWDICMLKGASEAWILILKFIVIFLHKMLRLVVGHPLQPTTHTISTHMNHVHIALILIIVPVIVHLGDNSAILLVSK